MEVVQEKQKLTIVSYNIHHGANIMNEYNLEKIISTVNNLNPNLVFLQEVDNNYSERSKNEKQPDVFLQKVNNMKKHYFMPTIRDSYGILSLTEMEVVDYEQKMLETGLDEDRAFQFLKLKNGLQVIHFHLSHTQNEYKRRLEEVTKIFQHLDEKQIDYTQRTIICGDFNEDCDEITEFKDQSLFALLQVKSFTNAKDIYINQSQNTHVKQVFTFTRKHYCKNIDHFFVSNDINVDSFSVVESDASDHNPILLSILI